MHAGQLDVSAETVRALIADQFPSWSGQSVATLPGSGTVNAIFRIGDELTARFPLQLDEIDTVRHELESEADAARELAGRTRFATPEPMSLGEPGHGYPLPWSVQTWVSGTPADASVADSERFAAELAEFIAGVRAIPVGDRRFSGSGRGGDLHGQDAWLAECFQRSAGLIDVPAARRLWARLRDLPRTSPDAMTHGDLIPGNVLIDDGRLAGVIDVGGLGPTDPALDLVGAWHLLTADPRAVLRRELGVDDLEWARGQAWAFAQAMGLPWYYVDSNPAMYRTGLLTLERILTDPV